MKYVCNICGYVYDEELGDMENDIEAGTKWDELQRSSKIEDAFAFSPGSFVFLMVAVMRVYRWVCCCLEVGFGLS